MQNSRTLMYGAVTFAIICSVQSAQAAPYANPHYPPTTAAKSGSDGGAAALAAEEKISVADATMHLHLQSDIARFLQTSTLKQQTGFSELYVRHNPYQIVIRFDRDVSADAMKALAPDSLKPYIVIETTGKAVATQDRFMNSSEHCALGI